MSLKNFYTSKYPTDELGVEINPDSTFIGLLDTLHKGKDVYEYFGVGDSILRERFFEELSIQLNQSYDYIYNLWLSNILKTK